MTDRRRMYRLTWNLVIKEKDRGGLGVGSIIMKNTSLLFKWIWRLGSRNYAYWKKIIVDKYTLQFTNGIPTLKKKLSPIWSDIVSTTNSSNPTADALRNSCHMRLDNDFNIRF